MKKRILVLAYEFFPTENANTRIIQNVCEILAEQYVLTAVTIRKPGTKAWEAQGNLQILRVPEYSFHKAQCTGPVTPGIFARMVSEKVQAKRKHDDTRMVERLYEHEARKAVRVAEYDAVISFSGPFLTHAVASRMVRGQGVPWIPVYVDPYFSNGIFDPARREERKKQEESLMEPASKILMTYPTDRDYLQNKVAFADKITGIGMPGVVALAPLGTDPDGASAPEESVPSGACPHRRTRCCFFGSLYKGIRDPRAAVKLFTAAGDEVEALFAGPVSGADQAEFFPEGGNCRHIGSLAGDELAAAYEEADVLVNIGNTVMNQMPSKIFEYISTGKPIINIYKSPECPTLKYLTKYPAALNIAEADIDADPEGSGERVRDFCREQKGNRVPSEEVLRIFRENTFAYFAEKLSELIEEA